MESLDTYLNLIDNARALRAKELSDIKAKFVNRDQSDPYAILSKAGIVLAYANWEGFYNECVGHYLDFMTDCAISISTANWMLLIGALTADFESLRTKNHSLQGKVEFIKKLQTKISCGFEEIDRSVVMARSNLNFTRLRDSLTLLGFETITLDPYRIRINVELVGWRHAVAHGSPPDLTNLNLADHLDFTSRLMLTVSDIFQEAITTRFSDIMATS